MRVAILAVLLFAAMVSAQPVAPIKKKTDFAGGAAICQPGTGVIAADGNGAGNGCAQCLAGYYQAGTGTLACTACPAGTWSPIGSPACYTCPAGTISGVASDSCEECGYGTVTTGYTSNGQFTGVNRGMTSGDRTTNTRCFPCDVDWYQPKAAQTVCLPCPANTKTAGAQGAGACFANNAGNTVAGKSGAAPGSASLMEVDSLKPAAGTKKAGPKPGVASGSANGSNSPNVKTAPAGVNPPIRKSKRGSYKAGAAKASKALGKKSTKRGATKGF